MSSADTVDMAIVNGVVMPLAQASVSVLDLGFLRGLGAFETFRTYAGGHPHALNEHLERLWRSAALMGVQPVFTQAQVRALLAQARTQSRHDELRVNVVVTPGAHTGGVFGADKPTWVAICRDLHAPPAAMYQQGVGVVSFRADRPHAAHKTTNYLSGWQGIAQAQQQGAHEAIYVDHLGNVTEGVTSNIHALYGSTVVSPDSGCIPGITRQGLIHVAREAGLQWNNGPLPLAKLASADEVWISSAVRELLPVVKVDGATIGKGTPGPWAKRLGTAYRALCEREAVRDAQAAAAAHA